MLRSHLLIGSLFLALCLLLGCGGGGGGGEEGSAETGETGIARGIGRDGALGVEVAPGEVRWVRAGGVRIQEG